MDSHRAYLLTRSYTPALIEQEDVRSIPEGASDVEGIAIRTDHPLIAWPCRSMGGQLAGIQTRRADVHEYRWNVGKNSSHLPILYGSEEDHDLFFRHGRVILTEGIFDRAAIKRCIPDYAVYARLSKGIAKHLLVFLKRYGKQVWTAFDHDAPGEKASDAADERLKDSLEINRLKIPAKDPSKLIEDRGERRAKEIVERQIRSLEV
jgi:5S rRNA maturation endonuclease (ribonuclease M5)